MVETQVKTFTSSHELPKKRTYTPSMHRRSLHTMGLHVAQTQQLKGKLCFILHYFLFLWSHLDFFFTLSVSPKRKVLILCFTYFTDEFRVCTNCACFQVIKTKTLEDLMLTTLHTIHDTDSTI